MAPAIPSHFFSPIEQLRHCYVLVDLPNSKTSNGLFPKSLFADSGRAHR